MSEIIGNLFLSVFLHIHICYFPDISARKRGGVTIFYYIFRCLIWHHVGTFKQWGPINKAWWTSRKKINKAIEDLNNSINQRDLIGICKTLQPTVVKFFWSIYSIFSNRHQSLNQKARLNNSKKIQVIQNIFHWSQ